MSEAGALRRLRPGLSDLASRVSSGSRIAGLSLAFALVAAASLQALGANAQRSGAAAGVVAAAGFGFNGARGGIAAWLDRLVPIYALAAASAPPLALIAWIRLKRKLRIARLAGTKKPLRAYPIAYVFTLLAGISACAVLVEAGAAIRSGIEKRSPTLPNFSRAPGEPGHIRIAIAGESSAAGEPYQPWVSLGKLLAWKLGEAYPELAVEVEDQSMGGTNLEEMHFKIAQLKHKPDLLIIYAGHNEFQSRFEWSREIPRAGTFARRCYDASRLSPFCRLLRSVASKLRLDDPPPPSVRRRLLDAPAYSESEAAEIARDFERRLGSIASWCRANAIELILIIPAANEAGFEPNRSVVELSGDSAAAALERRFSRSLDRERTDPAGSLQEYRDLVGEHPSFAEAWFRMGSVLRRLGRDREAGDCFRRALDADAFSLRLQTPLRAAYKNVAVKYNCLVIDAGDVFAELAGDHLLDDRLFHDAHHPVLAGQVALARALLAQLAKVSPQWARLSARSGLDGEEVIARFGLADREKWRLVAMRSGLFYRKTAEIRFDPKARYAKAGRYLEAANGLQSGADPREFKVLGLQALEALKRAYK